MSERNEYKEEKLGGNYVKIMRKTIETNISSDLYIYIYILRTAHKNHDQKKRK